ncbi:ASCH domain-containing protein [Draconibacterium mangrovi]|uniref:ASCH domain-containing protein n=1 Tax=Draconibacterium mangrovi TaxID=2697469 RepID=UPI001954286E|nr:ASCH domain-containing protein [Draconibacterium mangrovi]
MKQQQFIQCPECGKPMIADFIPNSGKLKNVSTIADTTVYFKCGSCGAGGMTMEQNEIDEMKPIPALSIRQPWAWLITNGYKNIENRNTLKNFRGLFLIHASCKTDFKAFHDHIVKVGKEAPIIWFDRFPENIETGGIIGYATITDCVQKSDSPWFVGPNGFVIEKPHPLPFTPCKGALGFFQPKIFTK